MQNNKLNELEIHPHEPHSMKKIVEFPLYNDWDNERKQKLYQYVKELAFSYDYQL
jgi:hypothetical protein